MESGDRVIKTECSEYECARHGIRKTVRMSRSRLSFQITFMFTFFNPWIFPPFIFHENFNNTIPHNFKEYPFKRTLIIRLALCSKSYIGGKIWAEEKIDIKQDYEIFQEKSFRFFFLLTAWKSHAAPYVRHFHLSLIFAWPCFVNTN